MEVFTGIDESRIAAQRQRDEFFWLDLVDPEPAAVDALGERLGLHPVALEDTREFGQRPKVDVYERSVLLVFYSARLRTGEERLVRPIEVHVYVSGGYVVTVRRDECTALDELRDRLAPEGTEDENYLVYQILDTLTDAYYPVIEGLEEQIDGLEREVLSRARRTQLAQIYRIRQEVRELQRIVANQRDTYQTASDAISSLAGLSKGSREYLRDVGDHLSQIAGELMRQYDDLAALTSTFFNANADRVNTVATRFTIVATFFVVSTFVTGFFGQNFGWLVRNVDSGTDFLIFGVGGLVVPLGALAALFWVKRRDWF
jgi:magnesium transporter